MENRKFKTVGAVIDFAKENPIFALSRKVKSIDYVDKETALVMFEDMPEIVTIPVSLFESNPSFILLDIKENGISGAGNHNAADLIAAIFCLIDRGIQSYGYTIPQLGVTIQGGLIEMMMGSDTETPTEEAPKKSGQNLKPVIISGGSSEVN